MISQRRLAQLGNRLAEADGHRVQERILERDYCIAWCLVGLSRNRLRNLLAFKGGTALKRCYFLDYRFSEDLDFSLVDPSIPFEEIQKGLEDSFADTQRLSGVSFGFAGQDLQVHQNSFTFYISFRGPIPRAGGPDEIKVDITIRELVVFPLADGLVLPYPEYDDLPQARVKVYSLDEIATEKIMALTDPVRNEPRDLHDLWFLVDGGHVDLGRLREALTQKLTFKTRGPLLGHELDAKEGRLRRSWEQRLAAQVLNLPEFDGVFRSVQRELKRSELLPTTRTRRTH